MTKQQQKKTKFHLVLKSAQPSVPAVERRARLFMDDGTEIFGALSVTWIDGELEDLTKKPSHCRIRMEFDGDQFTVER